MVVSTEGVKFPTIKELQDEIGCSYDSVKYGQSRAILNNLHKPVIGYCIGLAGFVAIYELGNGFPQAAAFTVKHLFSSYPDGSFHLIDIDQAKEIIQNNKLAIRKALNEEKLNQLKDKKHKTQFKREVVGELVVHEDDPAADYRTYKIFTLKEKGKYIIYCNYKHGYEYRIDNDAFINCYFDYLGGKPLYSSSPKTKIIKNTIPFEVLGLIMRHEKIKCHECHDQDPVIREKMIWIDICKRHNKKIKEMFVTMHISRSGEIKRSVPNNSKRDIYIDSLTGKEITRETYLNWVVSSKV